MKPMNTSYKYYNPSITTTTMKHKYTTNLKNYCG